MATDRPTCAWPTKSQLLLDYHDQEWGVPLHDDQKLFEFMLLDAFQAGLSWDIILKKRENFRRALHDFDPTRIAKYKQKDLDHLLQDEGIIRNRLKIQAAVTNAQHFLEIQREFDSFDEYIWQFVGGKPIQNRWKTMSQIPVSTPQSDAMSADLKKRGFKFVGSTICYAFMQAAGMVNDHLVGCWRYKEINGMKG
jgi:DNA-3-methyladenine glycosylase I